MTFCKSVKRPYFSQLVAFDAISFAGLAIDIRSEAAQADASDWIEISPVFCSGTSRLGGSGSKQIRMRRTSNSTTSHSQLARDPLMKDGRRKAKPQLTRAYRRVPTRIYLNDINYYASCCSQRFAKPITNTLTVNSSCTIDTPTSTI